MKRFFHEIFKLVIEINAVFIYILKKKLLVDFIINETTDFLQLLLNLSSFYFLIDSLL